MPEKIQLRYQRAASPSGHIIEWTGFCVDAQPLVADHFVELRPLPRVRCRIMEGSFDRTLQVSAELSGDGNCGVQFPLTTAVLTNQFRDAMVRQFPPPFFALVPEILTCIEQMLTSEGYLK